MVSCADCGCSKTTKNKNQVTFHIFPKDAERRKAWINFVKKPDFTPKTWSFLCSQHFAEEFFDRTSQLKVRLLPNALPTIKVDRFKYDRTSNPPHTRPVKSEPTQCHENVKFNDILALPGPVKSEPTQGHEKVKVNDILALPGPVKSEPTQCHENVKFNDILTLPGPVKSEPTEWHENVNDILAVAGPSMTSRTPSPTPFNEMPDTPCKIFLKRKIKELHEMDILKSQKIRKLQRYSWRLKKQIISLKSMITHLKKRNLVNNK